MYDHPELKENTDLVDRYFPFNIFLNTPRENNILHLHWHDYIEIIYVILGSCSFHVGSRTLHATEGDIVCVNSGQLHSGYSDHESSVSFYAIVFDKSLLASRQPDPIHTRYIAPFVDGLLAFPEFISSKAAEYMLIKDGIDSIIHEFDVKLPAYEIMIRSQIHSLIINLARYFVPTDINKQKSYLDENRIDQFKTLLLYISGHYNEKISIEKAAAMVSLSPFYFCKAFKKVTGRTFVDFINLYRVSRAEELLQTTSLPVTDIAEKVGYCNINYFDRVYKQYRKCSPSKFRQNDNS